MTWKSIVGTNVAADARQPRLARRYQQRHRVILGETTASASVIQERSYAYARSSIWLLDPRPDLPSIVRTIEKGFELSEASHAPVMLELRIRAFLRDRRRRKSRRGVVSGSTSCLARRGSSMGGSRIRR